MSEKQGPRTRSEKLRSEETQSCAPELIEEQLSRILVSREFSRSDRMARFLRHIVKAQIEGRTDDLKERSIGIDVFDRSIDWDPKIDNIVRSEARRLRNKLEQYYASSRSDDCVRISMPKGAYAPDFAYLKRAVPSVMTEPAELPTIPPASGSQFARPSSYYFALLFALVAVATFSIGIFRSMGSRETTVHAALADISPLANEIGAEISPAISSDGKWIAYAWDGNGGSYDIYMKPSNGGPDVPPKRLTQGPGMNLYPAWSPDGRTLAFVRIERNGASFLTKDLNAGNEKVLVRVRQRPSGWVAENAPYMDVGPSWLPDGRSLLYSDGAADDGNHGIYRVSLDEPEPKAIVTTEREVVDYFPRVSPNGRELAFVRYISHGVSDLYICSIDGSGLRRLTSDRRGIGGLAWAVDGRSLFYTAWSQGSPRIWTIRTSPGSYPEPLPDSVVATDIAVGPGGAWMAYASVSENWNIWRMSLHESSDGGTLGPPERLIASSGRNHGPSFSPDGKHLAFISDRTGAWQVWLADPNGEHPRQLTRFDGNFLGSISWTPNSKTIAFDARPSGNSNIYVLDVNRGGIPAPLDATRFEERVPSWSADGTAIYFNSNRDGVVAIWRKSLVDGSARKVGLEGSFKSAESALGKTLYFSVTGGLLYRAGPDGSSPSQLPGVISVPEINWVVADDTVYYTQQEPVGQIAFYSFRNGRRNLLARIPGQLVRNTSNLAVSRDRKWLLFAKLDQSTSDIVVRRFRDRTSRR
jgi:Tol biopolymer transport system component